MYATLACPDWAVRLAEGRPLIPDLPLDKARARRAVGVFNKLRLPDVAGQPTMAEAAGDWQRDIVRSLFGAFDPEGERFIREVLVKVPKKNSKTTGGAAIMMTALILNERPRAEYLLIGPTQAIADTAFQQALGMIEADPYLSKRFHPTEHTKTIRDRVNGSKLKIKSFDPKVLTGAKPVGVLIDELHELGKISWAGRVLGQIRGGILPFPEGFLVFITTESDQAPAGVWKEEQNRARLVRDGKAESSMLPVLYEFPAVMMKSGAWRDPANWWMVTPNRGRSITVERLVEDFADAQLKGEAEVRRWASQHLNIQIDVALPEDSWSGAELWSDAADTTLTFDTLLTRAEVIVVGGDGGGLDDLFGAAFLGRERGTRRWLLWVKAWAHPIVLKRRKEIASVLMDFAAAGDLTICDRPTQDVEEFAALCERVRDAGLLPEQLGIGVDKLGLPGIVDDLIDRGFKLADDGGEITGVAQGGYLNPAILGTERKVSDGTLIHAGQPLMDWCVGNAKVELKGSSRAVTKQASGVAKIDPLVAAFNAVMLMSRNPEAGGGPSVYESRGLLMV